jgi:hypothetical protein
MDDYTVYLAETLAAMKAEQNGPQKGRKEIWVSVNLVASELLDIFYESEESDSCPNFVMEAAKQINLINALKAMLNAAGSGPDDEGRTYEIEEEQALKALEPYDAKWVENYRKNNW